MAASPSGSMCLRLLRSFLPQTLQISRLNFLTAFMLSKDHYKFPRHTERPFCTSTSKLQNDLTSKLQKDVTSKLQKDITSKLQKDATSKVQKDVVNITFLMPDGEKVTAKAKVGDNLLDVVIENNVDIDGFGACEGTLACSTCHLIFSNENYNKLPEPPTDEELDMLDLAFDLQETSRLGCQVIVSKDMEGWMVKVPAGVADAREPS